MSFPRHLEIYRPMWSFCGRNLGATTAAAPTHRLDEFPAGYSSAGCAPAEPTSASPAGNQYAVQSFCRSRIFQRTANSVLTVCVSPGGKRKPYLTARVQAPGRKLQTPTPSSDRRKRSATPSESEYDCVTHGSSRRGWHCQYFLRFSYLQTSGILPAYVALCAFDICGINHHLLSAKHGTRGQITLTPDETLQFDFTSPGNCFSRMLKKILGEGS